MNMTNDAEMKVKIFRLIDTQQGKALQEVYDLLSAKLRGKNTLSLIEQGYKDMAADEQREREASEWIEGTLNTDEL